MTESEQYDQYGLEAENRLLKERLAALELEYKELQEENKRLAADMQRLRRKIFGGGSSMSTKLQDALRE